jgi:hypothetical protein
LALMRPDPDRLAAWSADETGADWSVILASAALVGALRGRRRMTTSLRPVGLDDVLARREADSRNAAAGATIRIDEADRIRLQSARTQTGLQLRLAAGSHVIGSWDVLRATADAASGIDAASDALARWGESRNSTSESALVALCDELGWDDCTVTVINTQAPLQEVEPGLTKYRVAGRVRLQRMLDLDGLRTRLKSAETAPEVKDRALALLQPHAPQPAPVSQRYSNSRNASSSPN